MIRKNHPNFFFTREEMERLADAIARIESRTNSRVEILLEWRCPITDPLSRAVKLFQKLGLNRHPAQNAALIYFATSFRVFSVVCGKSLSEKTNDLFWTAVKAEAEASFARDKHFEGTLNILERLEEVLVQYFPNKIQNFFPHKNKKLGR